MSAPLHDVIAALERVTLEELRQSDDESLHRFCEITHHWTSLAAVERKKRRPAS